MVSIELMTSTILIVLTGIVIYLLFFLGIYYIFNRFIFNLMEKKLKKMDKKKLSQRKVWTNIWGFLVISLVIYGFLIKPFLKGKVGTDLFSTILMGITLLIIFIIFWIKSKKQVNKYLDI